MFDCFVFVLVAFFLRGGDSAPCNYWKTTHTDQHAKPFGRCESNFDITGRYGIATCTSANEATVITYTDSNCNTPAGATYGLIPVNNSITTYWSRNGIYGDCSSAPCVATRKDYQCCSTPACDPAKKQNQQMGLPGTCQQSVIQSSTQLPTTVLCSASTITQYEFDNDQRCDFSGRTVMATASLSTCYGSPRTDFACVTNDQAASVTIPVGVTVLVNREAFQDWECTSNPIQSSDIWTSQEHYPTTCIAANTRAISAVTATNRMVGKMFACDSSAVWEYGYSDSSCTQISYIKGTSLGCDRHSGNPYWKRTCASPSSLSAADFGSSGSVITFDLFDDGSCSTRRTTLIQNLGLVREYEGTSLTCVGTKLMYAYQANTPQEIQFNTCISPHSFGYLGEVFPFSRMFVTGACGGGATVGQVSPYFPTIHGVRIDQFQDNANNGGMCTSNLLRQSQPVRVLSSSCSDQGHNPIGAYRYRIYEQQTCTNANTYEVFKFGSSINSNVANCTIAGSFAVSRRTVTLDTCYGNQNRFKQYNSVSCPIQTLAASATFNPIISWEPHATSDCSTAAMPVKEEIEYPACSENQYLATASNSYACDANTLWSYVYDSTTCSTNIRYVAGIALGCLDSSWTENVNDRAKKGTCLSVTSPLPTVTFGGSPITIEFYSDSNCGNQVLVMTQLPNVAGYFTSSDSIGIKAECSGGNLILTSSQNSNTETIALDSCVRVNSYTFRPLDHGDLHIFIRASQCTTSATQPQARQLPIKVTKNNFRSSSTAGSDCSANLLNCCTNSKRLGFCNQVSTNCNSNGCTQAGEGESCSATELKTYSFPGTACDFNNDFKVTTQPANVCFGAEQEWSGSQLNTCSGVDVSFDASLSSSLKAVYSTISYGDRSCGTVTSPGQRVEYFSPTGCGAMGTPAVGRKLVCDALASWEYVYLATGCGGNVAYISGVPDGYCYDSNGFWKRSCTTPVSPLPTATFSVPPLAIEVFGSEGCDEPSGYLYMAPGTTPMGDSSRPATITCQGATVVIDYVENVWNSVTQQSSNVQKHVTTTDGVCVQVRSWPSGSLEAFRRVSSMMIRGCGTAQATSLAPVAPVYDTVTKVDYESNQCGVASAIRDTRRERVSTTCLNLGVQDDNGVMISKSRIAWCDATHYYTYDFSNANCDFAKAQNPTGLQYDKTLLDSCGPGRKVTACTNPVATPPVVPGLNSVQWDIEIKWVDQNTCPPAANTAVYQEGWIITAVCRNRNDNYRDATGSEATSVTSQSEICTSSGYWQYTYVGHDCTGAFKSVVGYPFSATTCVHLNHFSTAAIYAKCLGSVSPPAMVTFSGVDSAGSPSSDFIRIAFFNDIGCTKGSQVIYNIPNFCGSDQLRSFGGNFTCSGVSATYKRWSGGECGQRSSQETVVVTTYVQDECTSAIGLGRAAQDIAAYAVITCGTGQVRPQPFITVLQPGTVVLTPLEKCQNWRDAQASNVRDVFLNNPNTAFPHCPPLVETAILDFTFRQLTSGFDVVFPDSSYTASTTAAQATNNYFILGWPRWPWIVSLLCAYNKATGGLVVSGDLAGYYMYYDPFRFRSAWDTFQGTARKECCAANRCDMFYNMRPCDVGNGYLPPRTSCGCGDPHFTTLDGLTYTFNGVGEYILSRSSDTAFEMQARTEKADPSAQGTVFTALAIAVKVIGSSPYNLTSQKIQVEINNDSATNTAQPLILKIGCTSGTFDSSTTIDLAAINVDLSAQKTDGALAPSSQVYADELVTAKVASTNPLRLIVSTSLGVSVAIVLSDPPAAGFIRSLNFEFTFDQSFSGTLSGLLGDLDGNENNDLTAADGTTYSSSSNADVFNFGKSWQVDASSSIFCYAPGIDPNTFSDPTYVPIFTANFSSCPNPTQAAATAATICQTNTECLFDIAATCEPAIGIATKNTSESIRASNILLNTRPNCTCVNGACQPDGSCACPLGFLGLSCDFAVPIILPVLTRRPTPFLPTASPVAAPTPVGGCGCPAVLSGGTCGHYTCKYRVTASNSPYPVVKETACVTDTVNANQACKCPPTSSTTAITPLPCTCCGYTSESDCVQGSCRTTVKSQENSAFCLWSSATKTCDCPGNSCGAAVGTPGTTLFPQHAYALDVYLPVKCGGINAVNLCLYTPILPLALVVFQFNVAGALGGNFLVPSVSCSQSGGLAIVGIQLEIETVAQYTTALEVVKSLGGFEAALANNYTMPSITCSIQLADLTCKELGTSGILCPAPPIDKVGNGAVVWGVFGALLCSVVFALVQ